VSSILIVDDEPQISGLLSALLLRAGHEVRTARNPQAAIEMCTPPLCFDLVLSEVSLPVMDGHELARWITGRCPSSRTILMSASAQGCEECPYAPHCALILKPFDPKAVLATVASALATPARLRCTVARVLSASYSNALNDFYNFPGIMQELHSASAEFDSSLKQKQTAYIALLTARADYRAHTSEHGCHEPPGAVDAYKWIKHRLRREMREAREAFESASQKLQRLKVLLPELEPSSEGRDLLAQTNRVYKATHHVYMLTLQRFSDFIRDEISRVAKRRKPLSDTH
jgi:CheY-like chemotaxis protein